MPANLRNSTDDRHWESQTAYGGDVARRNRINRHCEERGDVRFTPTSSPWLNLVERWFREITDKRIRRGVFKFVKDLVRAIMDYIQQHNADPETFAWHAKAEDILAKVRRARFQLYRMATA